MLMVNAKDIKTSRDMFRKRLQELKKAIDQTSFAARRGEIGECETMFILDEIDKEINTIIDCNGVLQEIKTREN